jgi:hypothetical protein
VRAALPVSVASSVLALAGCGVLATQDDFGWVGSGGGGAGLDASASPRDGGGDTGSADTGTMERVARDGAYGAGEAGDAGLDMGEGTGTVAIEASIVLARAATPEECPGISVFSIDPAGLAPGQRAQLTVATVGPPALVQWIVNPPSGGKFSSATALAPTFQCVGAGAATVTVTVSPAGGSACTGVRFTSYSAAIDCQE